MSERVLVGAEGIIGGGYSDDILRPAGHTDGRVEVEPAVALNTLWRPSVIVLRRPRERSRGWRLNHGPSSSTMSEVE